jgi:hypothetical protein
MKQGLQRRFRLPKPFWLYRTSHVADVRPFKDGAMRRFPIPTTLFVRDYIYICH